MRFLSFDTETTGLLDDVTAHVIEVGLVGFDANGVNVGAFQSFVCPPVLTPEGIALAARISGINEWQIRTAPEPAVVWAGLLTFLQGILPPGWRGPTALWNKSFDPAMMARTFVGCDVSGLFADVEDVSDTFADRFRTVLGHSPESGRPKRAKLVNAARMAGVSFPTAAHRAFDDAVACGRIKHLLDNGLAPEPTS